jgi:nucleotide-binding universal stress UspA family protein
MSVGAAQQSTRILVPVSTFVDRNRLFKALHVLATLKDPLIVLFRVVEVPRRTTPLDPSLWADDIKKAEDFLGASASWLEHEGYRVEKKVVTARNAAEGVIIEANNGGYAVVLLMKRRIRSGWTRVFRKSITEEVIRYANPLVLTFLAEQEPGEKKA